MAPSREDDRNELLAEKVDDHDDRAPDDVHEEDNCAGAPAGLEVIENENDVPLPAPQIVKASKKMAGLKEDEVAPPVPVAQRFVSLDAVNKLKEDEVAPPVPEAQRFASLDAVNKGDEGSVTTTKSSSLSKNNIGDSIVMTMPPQLELVEGDDENAPPVPIEHLASSLEAMKNADDEKQVASSIFLERNTASALPANQDQITLPPAPPNHQTDSSTPVPVPPTFLVGNDAGQGTITERAIFPTPFSMLPSSQVDADESFLPSAFTVLEATLVDDVIYDAVPFEEVDRQEEKDLEPAAWWTRRRKQCALVGLVSVVIVGSYFAISNGRSGNTTTATATTNLIWKPRGQPIVGNKTIDYFGSFVALSATGNILAAGTDGLGTDRAGYARLYYRSNDGLSWEQIGPDIIGDVIEYSSSCSVALSGNGTTLAVGFEENDALPGHVQLYSVNSSSWQRLGNVINGEAPGDRFGRSVSLSEDGKTVAVGGYKNDGNGDSSGHVRIYQMDDTGSEWTQLGNDIEGVAAFGMSGFEVDLSADGRVVVIGTPYHNNYFGQARVYYWNDNELRWEQRGKDLFGRKSDDNFGTSVAISGDGKIVAVGGPAQGVDDRKGYVRVYFSVDDDWQMRGDINGTYEGGKFGFALSLSSDGTTLAIGDPFSLGKNDTILAGAVRVFRFDDFASSWIQYGLDMNGNAPYDSFGSAISLSADGGTVVVGAPANNMDQGNVRAFSIEN